MLIDNKEAADNELAKNKTVHVVGAGLAGSEACFQALARGCYVVLHEMRPTKLTPAHQTGNFAELVCSNSLKAMDPTQSSGLLKQEMQKLGSLIVEAAYHAKVPAGQALSVDRALFSTFIENVLSKNPRFSKVNEEVTKIPSQGKLEKSNSCWVIASGPLTSDPLAKALMGLCEQKDRLYFYDAIAPIVATESLDMDKIVKQDRYQEDLGVEGDYLNVFLNKEQYENLIAEIKSAKVMPLHDFEKPKYFEACLPIEVMAERGDETLRFGPMKPVGLCDPKTGKSPYAAIQLRAENRQQSMYSLVGFQSKMTWPEQKRIFTQLPGLENAEFYRFGSIHRNTYINSPSVLNEDLSFKKNNRVFLAGQLTGVEGYTESAAIGLLAGCFAAAKLNEQSYDAPSPATMIGALYRHVVELENAKNFSPMNANFGLLPDLAARGKKNRRALMVERANQELLEYLKKGQSLQ